MKGDGDGVSRRGGDCGLPGELGGGWIPVPFARIESGCGIDVLTWGLVAGIVEGGRKVAMGGTMFPFELALAIS